VRIVSEASMARPGRPSILLVAAALAAAVPACVVDTGLQSSNGADASGTAGDAGLDAGTGADAGTGTDAGMDAGSGGSTDAGTPADAGSQGGGTGSGPSGPPAECAGLLPSSPGTMHVYTRAYDISRGSCGDAQGDATGVLTLLVTNIEHPSWRFVSSSGSDLGGVAAFAGEMFAQPFRDLAWIDQGTGKRFTVAVVDERGNTRQPSSDVIGTPLRWPGINGGLFLAGPMSATTTGALTQQVRMIEADGTNRWGPRSLGTKADIVGLAVDVLDRALVIVNGSDGAINARWFDRDGTPLTDFFAILTNFTPGVATWFEAAAVIGGGLAVRRVDAPAPGVMTGWHGEWLVVVSSGAAKTTPAPQWLASRRDTWLQVTRNGRAYAMLPMGQPGVACDQTIELLAPTGASCGSLDFAIDASRKCDTFDLRLALDGTVLQKLPSEMEAPASADGKTRNCTLRFWPAALR
jgi:hypothetical protein